MNDEVSVAELLEREGWGEAQRKPGGRARVMAVMLAVVLGCGLAALLVHFGSMRSEADSPSLVNLPHPPTGGLAGGGVPSGPAPSEVTGRNTTVVVTNQRPGDVGAGINELPGRRPSRETATQTVTVTGSQSQQDGPNSTTSVTTTPTADSSPSNSTANTSPSRTTPSCVLIFIICR
ncbi:hypothetical protein FG385_07330 [Amycolatopsis alkalitolerans]|uniref:Uncharacterized protein n=1 Tax=Amycolatopsis alkalitolerans TaxID=2547244 RepID=A0A5C4MA33_9PSEU|nr:hypothetical protein FG385_07330 [Amycolatopsis alkalitolerans]